LPILAFRDVGRAVPIVGTEFVAPRSALRIAVEDDGAARRAKDEALDARRSALGISTPMESR